MGYGVISVVGNKAKMMGMGVIDLRKMSDPYLRLGKIYERVTGIIESARRNGYRGSVLWKERAVDA